MFQYLFWGNFVNSAQIFELENKLANPNYHLEKFLKIIQQFHMLNLWVKISQIFQPRENKKTY